MEKASPFPCFESEVSSDLPLRSYSSFPGEHKEGIHSKEYSGSKPISKLDPSPDQGLHYLLLVFLYYEYW